MSIDLEDGTRIVEKCFTCGKWVCECELSTGVPSRAGRAVDEYARPFDVDRANPSQNRIGLVPSAQLPPGDTRQPAQAASFEHDPVYGGEATTFSAFAVALSAVVGAGIIVAVWLGLIG